MVDTLEFPEAKQNDSFAFHFQALECSARYKATCFAIYILSILLGITRHLEAAGSVVRVLYPPD